MIMKDTYTLYISPIDHTSLKSWKLYAILPKIRGSDQTFKFYMYLLVLGFERNIRIFRL